MSSVSHEADELWKLNVLTDLKESCFRNSKSQLLLQGAFSYDLTHSDTTFILFHSTE